MPHLRYRTRKPSLCAVIGFPFGRVVAAMGRGGAVRLALLQQVHRLVGQGFLRRLGVRTTGDIRAHVHVPAARGGAGTAPLQRAVHLGADVHGPTEGADLDAARITLANHRAYDLSGFYVVCTSTIGSQQLLRPTRLPFTTLERAVISELHGFFRPELIGRFDEKIVFKPLSPDTQREIALDCLC